MVATTAATRVGGFRTERESDIIYGKRKRGTDTVAGRGKGDGGSSVMYTREMNQYLSIWHN